MNIFNLKLISSVRINNLTTTFDDSHYIGIEFDKPVIIRSIESLENIDNKDLKFFLYSTDQINCLKTDKAVILKNKEINKLKIFIKKIIIRLNRNDLTTSFKIFALEGRNPILIMTPIFKFDDTKCYLYIKQPKIKPKEIDKVKTDPISKIRYRFKQFKIPSLTNLTNNINKPALFLHRIFKNYTENQIIKFLTRSIFILIISIILSLIIIDKIQ
ncbi:hypothetical protein HERIO_631 [Hepatospora eriocheir]|uniref:Uncharacterized protein n=1 Tax=Hepatospora eriocheir TaxID=1081669 RepID=A0A1X0QCU7_9MICR|nr:hypothetical protein HERIO_631 [Hepatospora eriocheir]